MQRNLFFFTILLSLLAAGCSDQSSRPLEITPSQCTLKPGGQITFSIKGVIGPNPTIAWRASDGVIQAQSKDGLVAVFTAPQTPGVIDISVSVTSNLTPMSSPSVSCVITPLDPTSNSQPPPQPGNNPVSTAPTVVISEVMGHQCGADDFKKFNQYVELYNYGDQAVDVNGWWLVDNGPDNKADQLVAWSTRNPRIALKFLVTDSTLVPPHGFAVVLSPIYTQSVEPHKMPYRLPSQTIILTVAEGDRIGDDVYGLVEDQSRRDVLVLYIGGPNTIRQVVSTYGTPTLVGMYPQDVRDDRADNLPLALHECASAERINPTGPDEFSNWREVLNGSPGEAPYR